MRAAMRGACLLLLLSLASAGDAPRSALADSGAASGSLALASPAGLLDLVPALPGLPASALESAASSTYAGYVDLPGTQRALFYALQTSERNPEKDPLVLWLKCVRALAAQRQRMHVEHADSCAPRVVPRAVPRVVKQRWPGLQLRGRRLPQRARPVFPHG